MKVCRQQNALKTIIKNTKYMTKKCANSDENNKI